MTHLLDTSALLAHYLADPARSEFKLCLRTRRWRRGLPSLRCLLNEVVDVTEAVRAEAIRLRTKATAHVAAMDVLRGDHSILSHELRRYSRATLERVVVGAGFTIVRVTYTNVTLVPLLAIVRMVQRARGLAPEEHAQHEIPVPWAPVNATLTGLLWLESLWLRAFNSPCGSSLLCLARKPA